MAIVQHRPAQADAEILPITAENVQLVVNRAPNPAHVDYWRARLYHKTKTVGGQRHECAAWTVKMQHGGRREAFTLTNADPRKAAAEAREIATHLKVNGWSLTLARYKPLAAPQPAAGDLTIGDFLEAVRRRFTKRPSTLALYASYLRRIAADIAGIDGGRRRFDCREGQGNHAWRGRVEGLPLSILTGTALAEWRTAYVAAAGEDPVRRASAERSSASFLRCARSLFQKHLVADLELGASPFSDVDTRAPRAPRYHSAIDAGSLRAAAEAELRPGSPNAYLALLLCLYAGLRKREADLLTWDQVDVTGCQIHIRRTRYFTPKSEESTRAVDMPDSIMAIVGTFKTPAAEFVLAGKAPRSSVSYSYYRCSQTWDALAAWLRGKGITEQKVVHSLRKESGSVISQHFGIEAAREHLGHRDLATTSSFYVTKKQRRAMPV